MTFLKVWIIVIISAILCFNPDHTYARDTTEVVTRGRRLTTELRPTYNMPTNGFYNGYNSTGKVISSCSSLHLKYSFTLSPESRTGKLYPTSYQGIGIGVYTFFSHYETGTPLAIYLFQGSRLFDLTPSISLDYEWNLGLSAGWKRNEVVGSGINILINVGIPFSWHFNDNWDFHITPDYTHFSNGDTTFPNGGANTFGVRFGASRNFGTPGVKAPGRTLIEKEKKLSERSAKDRITHDITVYGGWRADRILLGYSLNIINEHFPLGGLTYNPLYRFNRFFSAGASLDAMFDRSADIIPTVSEDGKSLEGYTLPESWRQTAIGLSVRGEVTMPFFSINIGAGYGLAGFSKDLKGFYTLYNLKCSVAENIYLNIGYRLSSLQYTHNLMLGFGIRI